MCAYDRTSSPLRAGKNCSFVFIHINKTAGTSIAETIGLPGKKHVTVREVIDEIGLEKWKQAYKFTSVRNPWDKVVSHYNHRVRTNQCNMANEIISFKNWVACTYGEHKDNLYYDNPKMFLPQTGWLRDYAGKIEIDTIMRFENIEEDFRNVANVLGIESKIGHLNKSIHTDYRNYYDNETKTIVEKCFYEDIMMFGYSFK